METLNFLDKAFFVRVFRKFIETTISVKVWGLIGIPTLSTWLLTHGYIEGSEWTTINTVVLTTIYGMRSLFQIARANGTDHTPEV